MNVCLPEISLVLLVGPAGSGRSTFARKHFFPTEVVSLKTNGDDTAFELLQSTVSSRLKAEKFTVVDAPNLCFDERKALQRLASKHDILCLAILFEKQAQGPSQPIKRERFHRVFRLQPQDLETATVERVKLYCDKRELGGPFDIIGDLHGCASELEELLDLLGYDNGAHPLGRRLIFVGDITDRGPRNLDCLAIVQNAVEHHGALCANGNHDDKLKRYLAGRQIQVAHGMEKTVAELESVDEKRKLAIKTFLAGLTSHYVLDGGKLVVAHAGIKEAYQGKASERVRKFCLYGETTGESDRYGLPVRLDWAADYSGEAMVVYGHTPVLEAKWVNHTMNIDTGCVYGGKLTALRYPELEVVSVPAREVYSVSAKVLGRLQPERRPDEVSVSELTGKQLITTRLVSKITVSAEQTAAGQENLKRSGLEAEWLIYLPPSIAPCPASEREDHLEYPTDAFRYYQARGLPSVMCQEKHPGSRAVLYLKRDGSGRCFSRLGRCFFTPRVEFQLLTNLVTTLEKTHLWEELKTDWLLLDANLVPCTANACLLLQQQDTQGEPITCSEALSELKLAPFHLLAVQGRCFVDRSHRWHLESLQTYFAESPYFQATQSKMVNVSDPHSIEAACRWWEELTSKDCEGLVVKPENFIALGPKGLLQPALKVRSHQALQTLYGADYTAHLAQLKRREMSKKRDLAVREFALGVEALELYSEQAPWYQVQRCILGIMALKSSAVDPRS